MAKIELRPLGSGDLPEAGRNRNELDLPGDAFPF
jgi:hypothetical protein